MRDLAVYKKTAVHTRSISATTYPAGRETVMIEGLLKDERLVENYSITTQEKLMPGVIHEIVLRILLRGPGLTIEDMEVRYVHMPRRECHETAESLMPLIGQKISPGFTSLVKKGFGGPRGCTHLNALLIAMAPAAVQGFWSSVVSRPISTGQAAKAMDMNYLVDSCWVWRSDGPLVRELRRTFPA
jgi:hypothetical protein